VFQHDHHRHETSARLILVFIAIDTPNPTLDYTVFLFTAVLRCIATADTVLFVCLSCTSFPHFQFSIFQNPSSSHTFLQHDCLISFSGGMPRGWLSHFSNESDLDPGSGIPKSCYSASSFAINLITQHLDSSHPWAFNAFSLGVLTVISGSRM